MELRAGVSVDVSCIFCVMAKDDVFRRRFRTPLWSPGAAEEAADAMDTATWLDTDAADLSEALMVTSDAGGVPSKCSLSSKHFRYAVATAVRGWGFLDSSNPVGKFCY